LRQTFRRHRCDPPADITRLVRGLPAGLVRLVEGLLANQPENRLTTKAAVQQLVALEIATFRYRHRRSA
jgi:hypothetical protein